MSQLLYPLAYLLSRVCDSTITTKAKSRFSTEKIRLGARANGDLRSRGSIALLVPQPGQKTSSQGRRRGAPGPSTTAACLRPRALIGKPLPRGGRLLSGVSLSDDDDRRGRQCNSLCCAIIRRSSPISSRRESKFALRLRHHWPNSNARFLRAICSNSSVSHQSTKAIAIAPTKVSIPPIPPPFGVGCTRSTIPTIMRA
jgi:hypothetical protein